MAAPIRTLTQLVKAHAGGDTARLLEPEEVRRGLEAVKAILAKGLPGKDQFYGDPKMAAAAMELAAFYAGAGHPTWEDTGAGSPTGEEATAGRPTAGQTGASPPTGEKARTREVPAGPTGPGVSGGGDRLYRAEVAELARGLADVADRLRLAAALRRARREAGFSIRELSRFSGVDHSYISRVEHGAVPRPSRAVMDRLAGALGVPGLAGGPLGDGGAGGGTAEDRTGNGGDPAGFPDGARAAERPGADLVGLGLHRAAVRNLLKVARDLPDDYLELLAAQARTMRARVGRNRP
ncbi:MAG: helix-turn-helix domain-containing protein [Bacillota bacterium]